MELQQCMKFKDAYCHPSCHTKCRMYYILKEKGILTDKDARKMFPKFNFPPIEEKQYESVYEITLTTTKNDPYELRTYINKIANSKIFKVYDMPYCIELTEKGLPHIHAILYSQKKYIDASKIKKIGFPYRFTCKRVIDIDAYNNYIKKEKDNPIVIDYCKKRGIPQFDNAIQKEIREIQQPQEPIDLCEES